MRILLATDTYYPNVNGAAYFTYRLAHALSDRENEVFVIAPSVSFRNTVTFDDKITVYGIRSLPFPVYPRFRVSLLTYARDSIKKAIREISPDVIHIQNHFMIGRGVVRAAKNLGIPIIGTNHFMPENLAHYFHLPKTWERRLKAYGWKQFKKIYGQLDLITTPTKTAARLLYKLGLNKEVVTVSCGIDLERFNPKNNGDYLRVNYGIPDNKPIVLYVGRMDKEKKVDVILKAFRLVLNCTDAQLVLVGIGKYRKKLMSLSKKLGLGTNVTFAGFVPDTDLQNIFTIAHVFVTAGIAELQCIAAMEAMACGLPVAAVDAMALPELVHNGENGYLFPDGDINKLAQNIVKILKNRKLRDSMRQKSLEIIRQHDIKKTIDTFESIYGSLVLQ